MLKATAGLMLPTTITGSLPRPSWYTENLGLKSFLERLAAHLRLPKLSLSMSAQYDDFKQFLLGN